MFSFAEKKYHLPPILITDTFFKSNCQTFSDCSCFSLSFLAVNESTMNESVFVFRTVDHSNEAL